MTPATTTGYAPRTGARDPRRVGPDDLYRWPAGFPGFDAQVTVTGDPGAATARLTVRPGGDPALGPAGRLHDWALAQLAMLVAPLWHAAPRGAGRPPGPYGPDGGGFPPGAAGDHGPALSLTVLDRAETGDGRRLPKGFMVTHWDRDASRITRVDVHRDDHVVVDGVWLPRSRRVVTATDTGVTLRAVILDGHRVAWRD